jgi:hypothetical protein
LIKVLKKPQKAAGTFQEKDGAICQNEARAIADIGDGTGTTAFLHFLNDLKNLNSSQNRQCLQLFHKKQ